jgi:hypothetical protein
MPFNIKSAAAKQLYNNNNYNRFLFLKGYAKIKQQGMPRIYVSRAFPGFLLAFLCFVDWELPKQNKNLEIKGQNQ